MSDCTEEVVTDKIEFVSLGGCVVEGSRPIGMAFDCHPTEKPANWPRQKLGYPGRLWIASVPSFED